MTSVGSEAERPPLLDKEAAARAKRERRRHREVVVVPRLRAVGSLWLLLAVLAHNWLLLPDLQGSLIASFAVAHVLYLFGSSWTLSRYYRDDARVDLATVFLAADVVFFVAAIYVSGGERSWLLPLLCVRVADQMATSRRRVLGFASWTAALHLLLVLYILWIEQRAFEPLAELAKVVFVYVLNLYLALAAGPSERQRKEAVAATAMAHDLIEQLAERTQQLEQARLRAESASHAKGTFLANISHELRTPMNAVLGMADLLLEERLAASQRKMVQTILDSGRSLLSLVNDVLDLSKIEAGELRLLTVDLSLPQLVESVLSPMRVLAENKGVELRQELQTDAAHGVRGDELRLRQVLFNLVGNAIKFTERGSVTMRVVEAEAGDGRVRVGFSVEDTGIGMTPAAAREVFEAFKQADESTTRRFGGTGLGLSISKRLVQLMGGELSVQTEPGRGSVFRFELLLSRAPLPAAETTAYTDASLTAKLRELAPRVFIAEDTEVNRMLLERLLVRFGCRATSVANGREAVDALTTDHDYALAFMDWHMPELDGITATQRVRQWEAEHGRRRTPIIGFTASAFSDETERCRRAGMDEVLIKPLMRGELERALRVVLLGADGVATRTAQGAASGSGAGLDPTILEELRALGDPQYVADLVEGFTTDAHARLDLLAGAIERNDAANVVEIAHALRGSAAGIGARRLASLAGALEAEARVAMPADAAGRFATMRDELEQLVRELDRLLAGAAASGF